LPTLGVFVVARLHRWLGKPASKARIELVDFAIAYVFLCVALVCAAIAFARLSR
jgi:hypothetical protein